MEGKKAKGLALLSPERRREIQSLGGKTISKNKEFMRLIGTKGGKSRARDVEAMKAMGAKGGSTPKRCKVCNPA